MNGSGWRVNGMWFGSDGGDRLVKNGGILVEYGRCGGVLGMVVVVAEWLAMWIIGRIGGGLTRRKGSREGHG